MPPRRESNSELFVRLDSKRVIHSYTKLLFATEVSFSSLDGCVTEQKLYLVQLTAGLMAETCTCATKIVRCKFVNASTLRRIFNSKARIASVRG